MDKESQRQNDAIERDLERAFNDIRGVVIQTSEAVQAVTLLAVGEALLLHAGHATDQEIFDLRNGQMPAGWEKGK